MTKTINTFRKRQMVSKTVIIMGGCLMLYIFGMPIVSATGLVLEIGGNDPGQCETLGKSMDLRRESSIWSLTHIEIMIGGSTKSKNMLSSHLTGCFTNFHAFYAMYYMSLFGGSVQKKYQRLFNELVTLGGAAHYFREAEGAKYEFSTKTATNDGYAVTLGLYDYATDTKQGQMIMFLSLSDNSIASSTIETTYKYSPVTREAFLVKDGSTLSYTFPTGFLNVKNGVRNTTPIDAHVFNFQFDTGTSQMSLKLNKFYQQTPLGFTAFYKDYEIEIGALAQNWNYDATKSIIPSIYFRINGLAQQHYKFWHVRTNQSPMLYTYYISSFAFDHAGTDKTHRFYAIGLPLDGNPLQTESYMYGWHQAYQDRIIIYEIVGQPANAQSGCNSITPYAVDVFDVGKSFLHGGFVLSGLRTQWSGSSLILYLSYSLIDKSHLNKLGSPQNKILVLEYPSTFRCTSATSATVEESSNTYPIRATDTNNTWQAQDDFSSSLGNKYVQFYGQTCASVSFNSNQCSVHDLVSNDKWQSGSKFLYMATTHLKYGGGNNANEDLSTIPNDHINVFTTNSGKKSIIVAGNVEYFFPATTNQQAQRFLRIYSASYNAQPSGFEAYSVDKLPVHSTDVNIQCDQMDHNTYSTTVTVPPSISALSELNTDVIQLQDKAKAISIDASAWHAASAVKCYSTSMTTVSASVLSFGLVDSVTGAEEQGFYYYSQTKVEFDVTLSISSLRSISTPYLSFVARGLFSAQSGQFQKVCINNGYAWQLPDIKTCMGYSNSDIASFQNRLFMDTGGDSFWAYSNSNGTSLNISVSASDKPSRTCLPSDVFSLAQSGTAQIEYEYSRSAVRQLDQSFLVSLASWTDNSIQHVHMVLLDNNQAYPVPFSNDKFELDLPNPADLVGTGKSVKLLIMHRGCAELQPQGQVGASAADLISNTTVFSSTPLLHLLFTIQVSMSDCGTETFGPTKAIHEFIQDWNDQTAKLLETDIVSLFNPPSDPRCAIKEWYLSGISSIVKLDSSNDIAVRLDQANRIDPLLDSLTFDPVDTDGVDYKTFEFKIQVYVRGKQSETELFVLHKNPATVNVQLGCYYPSFLNVSQGSQSYPNMTGYDVASRTFTFIQPQRKVNTSFSLDLTNLVKFATNYTQCGAHKIYSYEKEGRTNPTSAVSYTKLQTNPASLDLTTKQIPLQLEVEYGEHDRLPHNLYFRALTNDLVTSPMQVDWSLRFIGCSTNPSLQNDELIIQMEGDDVTVELQDLYEIAISEYSFCNGVVISLVSLEDFKNVEIDDVTLSDTNLTINKAVWEDIQFGIAIQPVSQKQVIQRVIVLAKVLEPFINIVIVFPLDKELLTTITEVDHSILCECDQITHKNNLILMTIEKADLTEKDVGSFKTRAFVDDKVLYTIELTVRKVLNDFKATAVLDFEREKEEDVYEEEQTVYENELMVNKDDEQMVAKKEEEVSVVQSDFEFTLDRGSTAIKPSFNPFAIKMGEGEAKEMIEKMRNRKRPSFVPNPDPLPVILKISEITRDGIINIIFNQPLLIPEFLDQKETQYSNQSRILIPLSHIDVNRDIMELIYVQNSQVSSTELAFLLDLTSWTEEKMSLYVNFTQPLLVSRGLKKDRIICRIKNKHLFQAKNSNEQLMSNRIYIQRSIPVQLPKGYSQSEIQTQAKSAQGGMLGLLFLQFLMQIFLKGSLDRLWNLFFTLQIICYLVIYSIPLPANTDIFITEFTKLIEFHLINPDGLIQSIKGDPDFRLISLIAGQTSKYGEQSILGNLSFYILVAVAFVVFVLVLSILYIVKPIRAKVKTLLFKIVNKFVFNGLIRSLTIAYIKLCITFGGQVKDFLMGSKGQSEQDRLAGQIMFVLLFGYPFLSLTVIMMFRKRLEKDNVQARISNLYADVKTGVGNGWCLTYYTTFLLQRFSFVAIPVVFHSAPWYQLQVLLFFQLVFLVNYVNTQPHRDSMRVKVEAFNQVMIMGMVYHMVCFSEFNLSLMSSFYMGYSFVGFMLLVILANLLSIASKQIGSYKKKKVLTEKRRIWQYLERLDGNMQQKLMKKRSIQLSIQVIKNLSQPRDADFNGTKEGIEIVKKRIDKHLRQWQSTLQKTERDQGMVEAYNSSFQKLELKKEKSSKPVLRNRKKTKKSKTQSASLPKIMITNLDAHRQNFIDKVPLKHRSAPSKGSHLEDLLIDEDEAKANKSQSPDIHSLIADALISFNQEQTIIHRNEDQYLNLRKASTADQHLEVPKCEKKKSVRSSKAHKKLKRHRPSKSKTVS